MPRGSFAVSDQNKAGSLYTGPAEIDNARIGKTDWNGKAAATTALLFDFKYANEEGDIETKSMILSMGNGIEPSTDADEASEEGPYFITTSDDKKLSSSAAAAIFFASLAKARKTDIDPDKGVADLNGLKVILGRESFKTVDRNKKEIDKLFYVVEKVVDALPWDEPKAKGAASPKAPAADKAATVDENAYTVIATVLKTTKKPKVKELPNLVDRAVRSWDPISERRGLVAAKLDIAQRVIEEEFLTADNDVFNYDKGTQSLSAK